MKIYNEVIIDMNTGDVISEDSYEYDGIIDLCCGSDSPRTDPHPYYYGESQPGGKLATSVSLPTPFGSRSIGGISSAFKDKKASTIGSPKFGTSFASGWYNPYFKAKVENPLSEMAETEGGGASPMAQWKPWQQIFSTAQGMPEEVIQSLQTTLGTGGLLPKGGLGSQIPIIADLFGDAQSTYDTEMKLLEDEQDASELTRKRDLLNVKVDRRKELAGRRSEWEEARAPIATSGMAYSGPAQMSFEDYEAEQVEDLSDIKRTELTKLQDYKSREEDIATRKGEAETTLREDKEAAAFELGSAIEGTIEGQLEDIGALGESVRRGHEEFGARTTQGHKYGRGKIGGMSLGGGTKVGGYFSETDIPEYIALDEMRFASENLMKSITEGGIQDYISNLFADVPTYTPETEG